MVSSFGSDLLTFGREQISYCGNLISSLKPSPPNRQHASGGQLPVGHVITNNLSDSSWQNLLRQKPAGSESRISSAPCCISSKSNSSEESDPALSEEFWASAEYCGYRRETFEPGTARRTGLFVNRAYARLAGLDPAEYMRRRDISSAPREIAPHDWLSRILARNSKKRPRCSAEIFAAACA